MELMRISEPNYRNFTLEESLMDNIQRSRSEMYESMDKIRKLEKAIRKLDPDYTSIFPGQTKLGRLLGR
jgi:hypothetical protein